MRNICCSAETKKLELWNVFWEFGSPPAGTDGKDRRGNLNSSQRTSDEKEPKGKELWSISEQSNKCLNSSVLVTCFCWLFSGFAVFCLCYWSKMFIFFHWKLWNPVSAWKLFVYRVLLFTCLSCWSYDNNYASCYSEGTQ